MAILKRSRLEHEHASSGEPGGERATRSGAFPIARDPARARSKGRPSCPVTLPSMAAVRPSSTARPALRLAPAPAPDHLSTGDHLLDIDLFDSSPPQPPASGAPSTGAVPPFHHDPLASSQRAPSPASVRDVMARGTVPPVPSARRGAPPSRAVQPPLDPHFGVRSFAGFGLPPDKLGETPSYALRVLSRRRVLREGLRVARVHRPRDVELYEEAIACADRAAFRTGMAILVTSGVVALAAIAGAVTAIL